MRRHVIFAFLGSSLFLGIVLFVFAVGFPPFDDLTTVDLSAHMLEHVLIVVAGVLIGHHLIKRGYLSGLRNSRVPSVGLLAVVVFVAFWHLPDTWDSAILNPTIHTLEHLSFLSIGVLIGSLLQKLSDYSKINALVLAFFGHMVYGIILISPLNVRVYPLYSFSQQSSLGLAILAPGPAYWAGVVYLLARNRTWFQQNAQPVIPKAFRDNQPPRRAAALTLSVLMLVVLAGYYGTTIAAITIPNQNPSNPSTVYMVETPVSWQFSPQRIIVMLGVNNTVTWMSRSISYDTVTGSDGSFSSGPIAPGRTFTHTFTETGEFEYKCIYHPWMVGYVTVVRGSGS